MYFDDSKNEPEAKNKIRPSLRKGAGQQYDNGRASLHITASEKFRPQTRQKLTS